MTDPEDPSRLLDSPAESAGLRDVLRAAAADVGSEQQVARLAKRLSPLLALGATGVAASSGVVKSAATSFAVKAGAAALALIVAGGGTWLIYASSAKPPPAPTPTTEAPVAQPAPPAPALAPPVTTPEAPASVALAEPAPSAAPKKLLSGKPLPAAEPTEGDLLEQARSALKSDPVAALARANEAAARFPRSALVQEREVIAIQALRKLGRNAEADQRASSFAKAFPDSVFQRKLDATP